MVDQIILKTSVDTFIDQFTPARFGSPRLYASTNAKSYMFWNLPLLPVGSLITSAKIKLYAGPDVTGTPTVDIRPALAPWNADNSLNWAHQPAEGSVVATLSAPTLAASGLWEFNVTTYINTVLSGGADWYGFVLRSNGADGMYWWGSFSDHPLTLEIQYTSPPRIPTDLVPNQGMVVNSNKPMLSWNTMMSGTSQKPYSYEVQIDDAADFTSPFTTGEVLSSASALDLTTTSFTATAGTTQNWRVRVRSADMLWSDWSQPATFKYLTSGTLTITTTTPMNDPTPAITWTFTGGATQAAYQVLITDYDSPQPIKYDSGILYGAVYTHTVPQGIWRFSGDVYEAEVRVWDTNARPSIAGQPSYTVKVKSITYASGASPAPVQIIATSQAPWPVWQVKWEHTAAIPDYFMVIRETNKSTMEGYTARTLATIPGTAVADAYGSPGKIGVTEPNWWVFNDYMAPNRVEITYTVVGVKAGVASPYNTTTTVTARGTSAALTSALSIALTQQRKVLFVNYNVDTGLSEVSDVVVPVNGPPALVTQSFQKYIGSVSGRIANGVTDLSAIQMRDNFLWLRKNSRCFLSWADESIECYIHQCRINPIPTPDGKTDYQVEFQFVQIGGGTYGI